MTKDEFWAEVEKLKTCKSRDLYFDRLAELCFKRIASLEVDSLKRDAEIEELKKNQIIWHELPASGVDETLDRSRQYLTRLDVKTQKWSWAYAFEVEAQ